MPRPRNRSRRDRSRRSKRGRGIGFYLKVVAMVLLPVLALGVGGYGLNEYSKIEQIGADFCYPRPGQQAVAAIFLDYSVNKDMSGAQRRDLVTALERTFQKLPVNGRVLIFTTARDTGSSLAEPVFTICRPAQTAAEQAAIGAPSKPGPNLRRIAADALAAYQSEIGRILAETQDSAKSALESPLLEQVQAISRHPGFRGRDRRFVWFSDGIQNTEIAQFCSTRGDMPSAEAFLRRPDYPVVAPESFAGTDVTVLLLETITLPQPGLQFCSHAEMRRWWPEFFRLNGADSVRLERLRRVTGS